MSQRRVILLGAGGAAFIAALFGLASLVGSLERPPDVTNAREAGSAATPAVIYATHVADLDGRPRALGEWSQRLLVVNFWASWCAPCLEEIPLFVTAQSRHGAKGLQIVGIAADSVSNARIFAEKLQINYPILADEAAAISISKRFGNRLGLLPFSIVLAPSGDILTTKLGVFTAAEIDQLVENHLRQSH